MLEEPHCKVNADARLAGLIKNGPTERTSFSAATMWPARPLASKWRSVKWLERLPTWIKLNRTKVQLLNCSREIIDSVLENCSLVPSCVEPFHWRSVYRLYNVELDDLQRTCFPNSKLAKHCINGWKIPKSVFFSFPDKLEVSERKFRNLELDCKFRLSEFQTLWNSKEKERTRKASGFLEHGRSWFKVLLVFSSFLSAWQTHKDMDADKCYTHSNSMLCFSISLFLIVFFNSIYTAFLLTLISASLFHFSNYPSLWNAIQSLLATR